MERCRGRQAEEHSKGSSGEINGSLSKCVLKDMVLSLNETLTSPPSIMHPSCFPCCGKWPFPLPSLLSLLLTLAREGKINHALLIISPAEKTRTAYLRAMAQEAKTALQLRMCLRLLEMDWNHSLPRRRKRKFRKIKRHDQGKYTCVLDIIYVYSY